MYIVIVWSIIIILINDYTDNYQYYHDLGDYISPSPVNISAGTIAHKQAFTINLKTNMNIWNISSIKNKYYSNYYYYYVTFRLM